MYWYLQGLLGETTEHVLIWTTGLLIPLGIARWNNRSFLKMNYMLIAKSEAPGLGQTLLMCSHYSCCIYNIQYYRLVSWEHTRMCCCRITCGTLSSILSGVPLCFFRFGCRTDFHRQPQKATVASELLPPYHSGNEGPVDWETALWMLLHRDY